MNLFSTLMVLIFFAESFWEIRLYSRLSQKASTVRQPAEQARLAKVMRLERRWNLFSWLLVLAALILPEHLFMPLACVLVLCETLVVMRLDQEDRRLS